MVKDLSYETVSNVNDSWQALKRSKGYDQAGEKLFQSLFSKAPDVMPLFGLSADTDFMTTNILVSQRFRALADSLLSMIDGALTMLGPDVEILTEILLEMGQKHIKYGCTPEMFPVLGEALVEVLEELLQDAFNDQVRKAWLETYDALASDMIQGLKMASSA